LVIPRDSADTLNPDQHRIKELLVVGNLLR
jgi:hypothetical protein